MAQKRSGRQLTKEGHLEREKRKKIYWRLLGYTKERWSSIIRN
jgi:hypothetical protein